MAKPIVTPPCAYCGKPLSATAKRYHKSRRDPFDDIESDSFEIACYSCGYTFAVDAHHEHTLNKARQRVEPGAYVVSKADFQRDPAEVLSLLNFAPVHVTENGNIILRFDQRRGKQ